MSTRLSLFRANRRGVWNHPTLQLGSDVVDLDSSDFRDVTSSDVEDDVNLQGKIWESGLNFHTPGTWQSEPFLSNWRNLQHLMTSLSGIHHSKSTTSEPSWRVVTPPVSLVDKIYFNLQYWQLHLQYLNQFQHSLILYFKWQQEVMKTTVWKLSYQNIYFLFNHMYCLKNLRVPYFWVSPSHWLQRSKAESVTLVNNRCIYSVHYYRNDWVTRRLIARTFVYMIPVYPSSKMCEHWYETLKQKREFNLFWTLGAKIEISLYCLSQKHPAIKLKSISFWPLCAFMTWLSTLK